MDGDDDGFDDDHDDHADYADFAGDNSWLLVSDYHHSVDHESL